MEPLICNNQFFHTNTLTIQQKCELLAEQCAEKQEVFNFFRLYFCTFNGHQILWTIFAIVLILVLFNFICKTIEEFVAPAMVYLAKYLKLSEALAGVTLLAFSNGAGDVITAIVASSSDEGISYNIGSLFGAGLFVLTIVIALTIKNSPTEIIIPRDVVYRDIGFYILATLLVIYFGINQELTVESSLGMLFLYVMYVVVVIVQGEKQKQDEILPDKENQEHLILEMKEKKSEGSGNYDNLTNVDLHTNFRKRTDSVYSYMEVHRVASLQQDNDHLINIVLNLIDRPFNFIRRMTIPPCDDQEYDHEWTMKWPFLGIPFIFFALFKQISFIWILVFPLIALVYYYLHTNPHYEQCTPPKYFILIDLLGIFTGILWTKLCVGVLVDLLTQIGMLFSISTTYIGLTILAVGNALPDGLTTIAIAKQGQAEMGITGGIAGQVFGLLIGFGASMLKKCLTEHKSFEFDIFKMENLSQNILDLLVIFTMLGTLVFIMFYAIKNNQKFDNTLSNSLMGIYFTFIVLATLITLIKSIFKQIIQKKL